ncbi:MAG: hypothetical protein NWS22_07635 [Porticoccaceae bacterium]|jgi:hypothetical protein|nr:hypothetical protein [Porticoccaceae bacterium]
MRRRLNTTQCLPAFLAVLLLVLVSSSHIHLRYCLDGAEAPISIHFESEETHAFEIATIDNLGEEDLVDIESELSLDSLLAKFSKTPTDSLAIFAFDLPAISTESKTSFQLVRRKILPDQPETLLPPTRAPPAIA